MPMMGQKVPIERPRVRTTDDQEIRLGSYELFHRGEPLTETVWEKLMLGLSTREELRVERHPFKPNELGPIGTNS